MTGLHNRLPEDDARQLRSVVLAVLENRSMQQQEFALMVGLSASTISELMSGHKQVTRRTYKTIAEALDDQVEALDDPADQPPELVAELTVGDLLTHIRSLRDLTTELDRQAVRGAHARQSELRGLVLVTAFMIIIAVPVLTSLLVYAAIPGVAP